MKKFLLTLLFLQIFSLSVFAQNNSDYLSNIGRNTIRVFRSLDLYLDQASQKIADNIINPFSQQAVSDKTNIDSINSNVDIFTLNQILSEIKGSAPYCFDVAYISSNGTVIAVQPQFFGIIGTNIGMQEHFVRLLNTRSPVVSKMFLAVEGFPAIAFQHPVISSRGVLFGAVSILIKPQDLLRSIINSETKDKVVDVWVMQDDGVIIYDADDEEIGKNLFTDDLYKPFATLIDFGKQVATQESGSSSYDFYERGQNKVVKKYGQWITIDVYGNKWKIVAVSTKDKLSSPYRSLYSLGLSNRTEALRALSKDKSFIAAISRGDKQTISSFFEDYISKYPCYAIQWVDDKYVNRVGIPIGHMITNYNFANQKNQRSIDFVNIIKAKKETTFIAPLFEGGIGKFHMVPIFDDSGKYYGMVYGISF